MTDLGQLPFTLFTEIAQTWVVQKDSVNTSIIHSYSTESSIVIIIYVDDLVIGGEHLVYIKKVKAILSDKFKMTDMKELHYFLGIEVIRTPAGNMIFQRHYILHSFEHRGGIQGGGGGRMWSHGLKRMLKDLGIPIKDPTPLLGDNMSIIYLALNPVFHARTKHIEVHYHFIRERVLAGNVDLQHISTNL